MVTINVYDKGQVDDLLADKADVSNVYTKTQADALLADKADVADLPTSEELVPDTAGASSGDVLTFNGSSVGWAAGGGGSQTAHTYATLDALLTDW